MILPVIKAPHVTTNDAIDKFNSNLSILFRSKSNNNNNNNNNNNDDDINNTTNNNKNDDDNT